MAPVANPIFEAAVDAVVDGDVATLRTLLARHPALPAARSARSHRATLLHHVAANGVEDERQRTPRNAVEVAEILLHAGATPDALADTYGGGPAQTPLCLLVSSCHPHRAGLHAELVRTLVRAGARPEGVEDDGLPVKTAIEFGYPAAAQALLELGARVRSPVIAAALGWTDELRGFLDPGGRLGASSLPYVDTQGSRLETAAAVLGRALCFAARGGHLEAAQVAIRAGADLAARAPQGFTPLHLAAWHGRQDMIEALVGHGAPLEQQNDYGGTVLDSTVWLARNAPEPGVDYRAVIRVLLRAGADRAAVKLPTGDEAIDALLAPG